MSTTSLVALIIAVFVVTLIAAVVAAAETAFTRINRSRADALAAVEAEESSDGEEIDARAAELQRLSRRPLTMLSSLTLVLVLCQIGAIAGAFAVGRELGGDMTGLIGVAVCGVVMFLAISLGRNRAMLDPDSVAVSLVPVLRLVAPMAALTRFVGSLARRSTMNAAADPEVDEQQLLALVEKTAAATTDEGVLLKRVVAFDDTIVGDIMTPRIDVVTLRSGFAVGDALEIAALNGLSRFPVTEPDGDLDDVIGAVHVKDLIVAQLAGKARDEIDLLLREVPIVPETQRIAVLLGELREGDLHLALVVDEHGGIVGAVTLEDVLEEIVGEIQDEFDRREPPIELIAPDTVEVDGRAEIARIEEILGVTWPEVDARTVGGSVFIELGRVPIDGDVLSLDGIEFHVMRMQGRRIAKLRIRKVGGQIAADDDEYDEAELMTEETIS